MDKKATKSNGSSKVATFDFDKPFSIILSKVTVGQKDEKGVVETTNSLIPFAQIKKKAASAQCSISSLTLGHFHRNLPGESFSFKDGQSFVSVSGSTTLSEYAELGQQMSDESRLTITWFHTLGTDPKKVLNEVKDPNMKLSDITSTGNRDIVGTKRDPALQGEQKMSMSASAKTGAPAQLSKSDWDSVIKGNQILHAFQMDRIAFDRLRHAQLAGSTSPKESAPDKPKGITDQEKDKSPDTGETESQSNGDASKSDAKPKDGSAGEAENQSNVDASKSNAITKNGDTVEASAQDNGSGLDPKDATSKESATTTSKASHNDSQGIKKNADAIRNRTSDNSGDPVLQESIDFTLVNLTPASVVESVVPIKRSTRAAFVLLSDAATNPEKDMNAKDSESKSDSTNDVVDTDTKAYSEYGSNSSLAHPQPIWCNSKSVSTTTLEKTNSVLQQWSLSASMSKESYGAGLGFPLGKVAIGAKFGFEREHSEEHTTKDALETMTLNIVHEVPMAQININESTVDLCEDAKHDVIRLRRDRKFVDLLSFFGKYGTLVYQNLTLGGRLIHTEAMQQNDREHEDTYTDKKKKSANASLGIPQASIDVNASKEEGETKKEGEKNSEKTEFLDWKGIGGNPGLVVDPPKWRESLINWDTWTVIKYDNPVRIDHFIGRLPGYSDVPLLFSQIMSTGVLNKSVIVLPPEGLLWTAEGGMPGEAQTNGAAGSAAAPQGNGTSESARSSGRQMPSLGTGIFVDSGLLTEGAASITKQEKLSSIVAPECYSWAVFLTDRDVKREIIANLQTSFNIAANVPYQAPFLNNIKVDKRTFTVMVRWMSMTSKVALSRDSNVPTSQDENVAANSKNGDLFFSSLKSRAWVICLWQVSSHDTDNQRIVSKDDFYDLRLATRRYFSSPRAIEEGCDYFVDETSKVSTAKARVAVSLYASDGVQKREVHIKNVSTPGRAFCAIDRRIRNSSINILPVSGTVESYDRKTSANNSSNNNKDADNDNNELLFDSNDNLKINNLARIQEFRASVLFLATKMDEEALGGLLRNDKDLKNEKDKEMAALTDPSTTIFDEDGAMQDAIDDLAAKFEYNPYLPY